MKKTILIALLAFITEVCFCQEGGPLKFLGIPIDGTEAQFGAKLKNKGFTYNSVYESYKGQFNGRNVDVYIHTNHNIVDRVYVSFPPTTEENIRVEFNRLIEQFNNTGKYADFSMNETIPADEDISYEMTVNNKRYQASFCYYDQNRDPIATSYALVDTFSDYFTKEQLAEVKEYIKKSSEAPENQSELIEGELTAKLQEIMRSQAGGDEPDPEKALQFFNTLFEGLRSLADGDVWFMIHERYGRYNIGLYYDNLHNQAHGEDL